MKISCRFEISFRSKWPKRNPYRFLFYFASIHVITSKELTKHRCEIFNWNEISYRFEFILLLMCHWLCPKIVWHPRKCPKVTFLDIFFENVDYNFIFYQHIHFLERNSMKKEISKIKITTSCLWGPKASTFYRVCILIFQNNNY